MSTEPYVRVVRCPRCHQHCGWCDDYRWLHGTINLPGTNKRCTIAAMAPEGDQCPLCRGSRTVRATTTYEAVAAGASLP